MWERWKKLQLWPWDWLTDGRMCEEHITSIETQDHMYNEAQEAKSKFEAGKNARKGETQTHESFIGAYPTKQANN